MTTVSAAEGYALWAETFDTTPSPVIALEERALRPWIPGRSPRRAVDVGCGTGRWTTRLNAIGFDASTAMLAVGRGTRAVALATALPVRSASADFILCALTLGHLHDPAAAMREFARILEPGGTLIVTDFHPAAGRRTFRSGGQLYELENYPYALDDLRTEGLALRDSFEATFGEPEREVFRRAGRPELFDAASQVPAVLLARWTRV